MFEDKETPTISFPPPPPSTSTDISTIFSSTSTISNNKEGTGFLVVPANVLFRGVNMKCDLKIDTSDISKAVEKAVAGAGAGAGDYTNGGDLNGPTITISTAQPSHCRIKATTTTAASSSTSSSVSPMCVDSTTRCSTDLGDMLSQNVTSTTGDANASAVTSSVDDRTVEEDNEVSTSAMVASSSSSTTADDDQEEEEMEIGGDHQLDNTTAASMPIKQSVESAMDQPPSSAATAAAPSRKSSSNGVQSTFCEFTDKMKKGQQCKQRAILSYKYCIRHILLDPSAPYRQCQHRRKPKSKRDATVMCTNAIRINKSDIYCSTHLIMHGLLEPKRKPASSLKDSEKSSEKSLTSSAAATPLMADSIGVNQPPPLSSDSFMEMHSLYYEPSKPNNNGNWMSSPSPQQQQQQQFHRYISSGTNTGTSCPSTTTTPFDNHNTQQQRPSAAYYNSVLPQHPQPQQQIHDTRTAFNNNRDDSLRYAAPIIPLGGGGGMVKTPHSSNTPMNYRQQPQPFISSLSKQHPQLAAKLLQPLPQPQQQTHIIVSRQQENYATGSGDPSTIIRTTTSFLPPAPPPQQPEYINTDHSLLLQVNAEPLPLKYDIDESSDSGRDEAERIRRDYLTNKLDPTATTANKRKNQRVIKLRQKRQRVKVNGAFRSIPTVDSMCRAIESVDFDHTDLFPLGLEPSDDDDESSADDLSFPSLGGEWLDCTTGAASFRSNRLELYLLKKQLRLESSRLVQRAKVSVPIIQAAKSHANNVGASLCTRSLNRQRESIVCQSTIRSCFHVSNVEERDQRSGELIKRSIHCTKPCLPRSNHCAEHIGYNVSQRLFVYCSRPCCGRPVLCTDVRLFDGLCRHHYEAEGGGGGGKSSSRKSTRAAAAAAYNRNQCVVDPPPQRGRHFSTDQQHKESVSSFYSSSSTTAPPPPTAAANDQLNDVDGEGEVSLALVVKDLGFDGRELNDMLAHLPMEVALGSGDDDDDEAMVNEDGDINKGDNNDVVELGQCWADINEFLISEGYNGEQGGGGGGTGDGSIL